jgi:hypothetical protein
MPGSEFLIHEVNIGGGVISVTCIVNKGDIALGDLFFAAQKAGSPKQEVSLSVRKIIAYRRKLNPLPSGMSGDLILEGRGADGLSKHDMLLT